MAKTAVSNPVQAQFDEFPYPNVPIEQTVTDNFALFANSLTTARYLRDRKVVLPEGKVILNAGCGSGWETLVVATANPGARYVGVDISPESIKMAEQRFKFHQRQRPHLLHHRQPPRHLRLLVGLTSRLSLSTTASAPPSERLCFGQPGGGNRSSPATCPTSP